MTRKQETIDAGGTGTVGKEKRGNSAGTTGSSELGERLARIREKITSSGEPQLSWDEVEREVEERRGGVYEGVHEGVQEKQDR